jgi:hypothetical protein
MMVAYTGGRVLKTLTSIERTFELLNGKILEALARLDEATARISALGEIHFKLAKTITGVLGIPQDVDSGLDYLLGPMGAISTTQRAESITAGLMSPIIRSLRKPCRDIAQAINAARENILRLAGDFDFREMEITAEEFCRDPDRVLSLEQQKAFRDKIKEWTLRLKDSFSA